MGIITALKELAGIKTNPESYEELWAYLNDTDTGMPEDRLCAHQVHAGQWDLYLESKNKPFKYASPLTLSFSYSANPEPIVRGLSTQEMQDILFVQDERETNLPGHISLTAKLD